MQNYYFTFKGCFKLKASSLKQFVSLPQSLCQGSVLYLHDVQLIFFKFLLLSQTSLFSPYCFSGAAVPVQQVIQTHLSTSAPVSLLKSFNLFSPQSQSHLPKKLPSSFFLFQFSKPHLSTLPCLPGSFHIIQVISSFTLPE